MNLETLKEEIRARADIVDIIGRVVPLKRAGSAIKGLCPFHQEKTPSFNVDQKKQTYYCFGCHAGGDVFNFVMEYEKVDFMTALERLAQQTGVPFELDRDGSGHKGPKKDRLYAIHEQVCAWFEETLHRAADGTPGRQYVEKRQLGTEILKVFRVGYALDSFDALLGRTREAGFSDEEIEASGLFGIREDPAPGRDKFYDRFRGRLMFPIRDEMGRVIGFSGRVLNPEQSKAKYVNSPETVLFKKSRVLYGIDLARKEISNRRQALLCEGQLDVIRCHEAGLTHAVAAQGTAVTEEHAHILKRYADEVVLLLDSDTAGIKAALKSAEILLAGGLTVRVASLPEAEDPDSLVIHKGPEALKDIVRAAESYVLFQIKTLMAREPEINEASRMRVIRAVVETIALAPEAAHREELLQQAAKSLGVREEALREDMRPAQQRTKQAFHSSPPPLQPQRPKSAAVSRPDRLPAHEDLFLELLCSHPELIEKAGPFLKVRHVNHAESRAILETLYGLDAPDTARIQDAFREHPARNRVSELLVRKRQQSGEKALAPERALHELIMLLREQALKRQQEALQSQLSELKGDKAADVESEIWQLTLVARKLRECRQSSDWTSAAGLLAFYD
jgi:DNA primase